MFQQTAVSRHFLLTHRRSLLRAFVPFHDPRNKDDRRSSLRNVKRTDHIDLLQQSRRRRQARRGGYVGCSILEIDRVHRKPRSARWSR